MSDQVEPRFKVPRARSPKHLARIRKLACSVPGCQRWKYEGGVVAHHLTIGPEPKARGLKASDAMCVPLCWNHHDARSGASLHNRGDEKSWWLEMGIDPIALAQRHADESRRLGILI